MEDELEAELWSAWAGDSIVKDGVIGVGVGVKPGQGSCRPFSSHVSLILSRGLAPDATRLTSSDLQACPSTSVPLDERATFLALTQDPCRIDRLELDLSFEPQNRGQMSLTSPSYRTVALATLPQDNLITPGLARPESMAPLARFESHPLGGLWTLQTLSFTVPPEYSGRYFAIHARGLGVENLFYDLSAGVAP